jgi:hypothetical protein
MTATINGSSPSITFSDGTTQATSAVVGGRVPTSLMPVGTVLQVVAGGFSTQVNNSSSSLVSAYSLSITPTSSTSKIFIVNTITPSVDNATNNGITLAIYRNAVAIINYPYNLYDSLSGGGQRITAVTMSYLDSPATTSSTSYSLYFGSANNSNAVHINQYGTSVITLMEIAA